MKLLSSSDRSNHLIAEFKKMFLHSICLMENSAQFEFWACLSCRVFQVSTILLFSEIAAKSALIIAKISDSNLTLYMLGSHCLSH